MRIVPFDHGVDCGSAGLELPAPPAARRIGGSCGGTALLPAPAETIEVLAASRFGDGVPIEPFDHGIGGGDAR